MSQFLKFCPGRFATNSARNPRQIRSEDLYFENTTFEKEICSNNERPDFHF